MPGCFESRQYEINRRQAQINRLHDWCIAGLTLGLIALAIARIFGGR